MNKDKPTEENPGQPGVDFLQLMDGVDTMREILRSMVAGCITEGFTDEQAHQIVTAFWIRLQQETP